MTDRELLLSVWAATGDPAETARDGDVGRAWSSRLVDGVWWLRNANGVYARLDPPGPTWVEGASAREVDGSIWWGWPSDRRAQIEGSVQPGRGFAGALEDLGVAPATGGEPTTAAANPELWGTLRADGGWSVTVWPEQRGHLQIEVDAHGTIGAGTVHTGAPPPTPRQPTPTAARRVETPAEVVLRALVATPGPVYVIARRYPNGRWALTLEAPGQPVYDLSLKRGWTWALADLGDATTLDDAELVQLAWAVHTHKVQAAPTLPVLLRDALIDVALRRLGASDALTPTPAWSSTSRMYATLFPERLTRQGLEALRA